MEMVKEKTALFATGAVGYSCIEILARGYTHWTMALTGGMCLVGLVAVARKLAARPVWLQAAAGSALITSAEFGVGVTVNLALGWQVWDYSKEFGNILGQICPLFSFYWFLLCLPVMGGMRLLRQRAALIRSGRTASVSQEEPPMV